MLVLTRRDNDSILIGETVRIMVRERDTPGTVNLVVEAPSELALGVEREPGEPVDRRTRSVSAAGRTLTELNLGGGEWLRIGDDLRVCLCPPRPAHPSQLRIGIVAPGDMRILRGELVRHRCSVSRPAYLQAAAPVLHSA